MNLQATSPAQDTCEPVPAASVGEEQPGSRHGHEAMTDLDRAMLAELVDTMRRHPAASAVTTSESRQARRAP